MISAYSFSTQGRLERKDLEISAVSATLADPNLFVWIDLEKPAPDEAKNILETLFHFHPLSIEDCIAASPAPKVEQYQPQTGDAFAPYLFLVLHAVDYNQQNGVFATSDLDFFVGKKFLVTYHDVPLRTIASIKDQCAHGAKDIARGPDHLMHALLDSLVENYKPALEQLSVKIAELEQQVLQLPAPQALPEILRVKKEVLHLRQIIGAQSEVMARLAGGEFDLIRPHLVPYFRDVHDALFHIANLAQTYADSLTGLLQVYLSMSSNQTNDVVKVLTLITVITTPLMMIGTWYGMNFRNMPELQWRYGYPVAAGVVALSTGLTVWYFKKRKWF